jgi:large subunit ribosomal protein L25
VATKELKLTIEQRNKTGTTGAQRLRREGKIPAVVYGHGREPMHVAFSAKAFDDLLHRGGRTGLISLSFDGGKTDTAIVRDIQRNPVTRHVQHVDLQRVSEREEVRAKLPVVTIGTPLGVRMFGGVMDVLVHEIDVEGPVNELPDHVEVDVDELGIHQHCTAAEVKLPQGFKLLTSPDTIVVSVEPSKTAQHLEEAEAAAGAPVEEAIPELPVAPAPETPA